MGAINVIQAASKHDQTDIGSGQKTPHLLSFLSLLLLSLFVPNSFLDGLISSYPGSFSCPCAGLALKPHLCNA